MNKSDAQYFISELSSGLQDRIIVAPFYTSDKSWQIIYLRSGAIDLVTIPQDIRKHIEAPALLCLPVDRQWQVRLGAGSSGMHLAVNDIGMTSAIGSRPEAVELRIMVSDLAALPLGGLAEQEARISAALHAIMEEDRRKSPGHVVILEAHLRCLLIHFWREVYKTDETITEGGHQTILLRRFRQLLETHYRSRWRVRDYANALGTTADQLHNLATLKLKRKPLDLIHERSHREAKALLTRSNMTLEQIAAYLGFKTSAQFSALFRKLEGLPPGKYRSERFAQQTELAIEQDTSFYDWP